MTESEYRSHPALNASRFKAFIRSPFHFENQVDVETTEAMKIGTAIHTALLEPEIYASTIAFMPECDRRTTAGKQIAKEFEEQSVGKLILKHESEDVVIRAIDSVSRHLEWKTLKENQMHKETIIIGEMFGIECKAKIDIIDLKKNMIWDIKTCQDASAESFKYEVQDRLYWVQQAFYKMLVEKHYGSKFGCGFIATETTEPSATAFHQVSEKELELWEDIVKYKLQQYIACRATDVFPAYESGILPELNLSKYKNKITKIDIQV